VIQKIVPPKKIAGEVLIPPDKSITHRAVLFSSLAKGLSTIENPLEAEDCLSTLQCIEDLGCRITKGEKRWTVEGKGLWGYQRPRRPLHCGNSGTTMRLLSGILSAQPFETELLGDESLSKRPMARVADPLRKMGAAISLHEGNTPPMKITGSKNLKPLDWENPISSAQVKSAILLAALHTKGKTTYSEPTLSRDHTERMLEASGITLQRENATIAIEGSKEPKVMTWVIPGDFSSAAFFVVAALIKPNSSLTLKSVNVNPTRTGLLDVLKQAGAQVQIKNFKMMGGEPVGDIEVTYGTSLKAFEVKNEIVPRLIDEIPILAVLATQSKGVSVFYGVEELRHKESDRIATLSTNLRKMGAKITEEKDGFRVEGPTRLKGATVSSFGDHRIGMACAIAALAAQGESIIEGSEAYAISFVNFPETMTSICLS